jgi:hypothetical protein
MIKKKKKKKKIHEQSYLRQLNQTIAFIIFLLYNFKIQCSYTKLVSWLVLQTSLT